MPRTVAFGGESLSFSRAYTSASDTVTALPVLTGGCFGPSPCPTDLLAVCRNAKLKSSLVIPRSANRFLAKLVPGFRFDEVVEVADWDEQTAKKEVWGYGADRPTAMSLSQRSLEWIDAHPGERFLLWAFNFDVHNWMHLDEQYLAARAAERGIVRDEADKRWRYEAAAVGVDQALDHLLRGLADRGLDQRTVVLFVSDHGEGLGRNDHWVHAVFLWESLMRVPMMLRVPGLGARTFDTPVGHVDLAPTLARFVDRQASVSGYHGVDLLRLIDGEPLPDALPLLIQSWRKEELLRVGLIPREPPFRKLVLPLESVEPELYELTATDPDELDLELNRGPQALGLLDKLVTSPVFPRPTKPK